MSGTSCCKANLLSCAYASWALVWLLLLSGCASNSITSLLKASRQTDPIVPSATTVRSDLEGHAFEVGNVFFELHQATDKQGPDVPDSTYLELFGSQVRKAFSGAELAQGRSPAYPVNLAIEQLRLEPATLLFGKPSMFRVRMEIAPPDGPVLMRGQFEASVPPPVAMIYSSGFVIPLPVPWDGQEYVALSKMFPAMAVVIAATTRGLQQGKTLDEIKIYPRTIEAGNTISPDLFLEKAPFGMTRMSYKEIEKTIRASQAREHH
jgi:hypothetical protein